MTLKKAALCSIFVAASLGLGTNAAALSARNKPIFLHPKPSQPIALVPKTHDRPFSCAQRAPQATANRAGYPSIATLRRASALAQTYDPNAVAAIALASSRTGVDFDLLIMKAFLESRIGEFDEPHLGGSARGLFHFMPTSWLTLFSWFGAEFQGGIYADAASMIKFDADKNTYTDDPALSEQILALRSDHYVAAFIKAKSVLHDERPLMRAVLGREPNFTDYYVAHFLGLDRAKTFFRALRQNPRAAAADTFVKESEDPNNRPLFYNGQKKLTVQQVYNRLAAKVDATFRHLDRRVSTTYQNNVCVAILPLKPPERASLAISNNPTLPPAKDESPRPEIPPQSILVEGDGVIAPAPAPNEPNTPDPTSPTEKPFPV